MHQCETRRDALIYTSHFETPDDQSPRRVDTSGLFLYRRGGHLRLNTSNYAYAQMGSKPTFKLEYEQFSEMAVKLLIKI